MFGRSIDLREVSPGLLRCLGIVHRDIIKTDDSIHRRSNLMAHVGQECSLRLVRLLGRLECITQCLLLCHVLSHFGIDYGKAQTDGMNTVIFTFFDVAYTCDPDHLVIFSAVTFSEITVSEDGFFREALTDILRIYELQESFAVTLFNGIFRIPDKTVVEREFYSFFCLIIILRISSVADALVLVEIDIVDTAVI